MSTGHAFARTDEPNPDHEPCAWHADRGQACRCNRTLVTIRCACRVDPVITGATWPQASQAMSAHVADWDVPVETRPTTYVVNAFPAATLDQARNARHFEVRVEWRGFGEDGADDRWAVLRHGRECWNETAGEWEFESSPSNREDGFIAQTRWPLEQALAIARRLAPEQGVNGMSVKAALAYWGGTGDEL